MFSHWKLKDFEPGEGEKAGAAAEAHDLSGWIDVAVPGDVHTALIAAGRIPDPFYDRNEAACRWVEDREWWYRLAFEPGGAALEADERLLLVFHGLDTFATVWLNGVQLGRHENMFREANFDVSQILRPGGPNTLAVRFDPPLLRVADREPPDWSVTIPERVHMRKAQFGYGWDWGPRLPTVGIWRPVELRRQRQACIRGVHFTTLDLDRAHDRALVKVRVEVEAFAPRRSLDLRLQLNPPPGEPAAGGMIEQLFAVPGGETEVEAVAYLTVDQPRLWWTHDLGQPALYDLQVELLSGDQAIDRWQGAVGIRTLALDESPDPDERGTRFFRFVLNGVPVFARGANWIPAGSFVGSIPEERYSRLLDAAQRANMNMLRVWGGGIYEHDALYTLCDRLGLLVWQDFMFSCAAYPEEPESFVEEVRREAEYQVRRLRSHPCLALWCGNNENQWIHDQRHWDDPGAVVPGALYYNEILPQAVARWDGSTPYWPGSPYGGNDHNSPEQGDAHNWQVWHGNLPRRFGEPQRRDNSPQGVSYLHYAEDLSRFVSEFGMHASPVMETLRRVIPPGQLYFHSPAFDHHNKDNPKNKGDHLMQTVTGLPESLEQYIDFSMIAQAEGLKFGVEHYRRRKPHCSGALVWQLNDCWPALSWSLVDYYGFGKAGYYYTRRAFAPVLASFKPLPGGGLELWITNDTLSDLKERVTVRNASFAGSLRWQEQLEVRVPANSSRPVRRWGPQELQPAPDSYLWVSAEAESFPPNRHFFSAIRDLERQRPTLSVHLSQESEHEIRARLSSDGYACFVHLELPQEWTVFSDNYFDLEPGEERWVRISNPLVTIDGRQVSVQWR